MIQREVTDKENVKWSCVQAYSGMQGEISEKATELSKHDQEKVTVICTPTGGAKSVRLELDANWNEQLQNDELLESIAKVQG